MSYSDDDSVPDWVPTGRPSWWSTAEDWFSNPRQKVQNVVFGMLLAGIAAVFEPIFRSIELLTVGSDPAFAADGETWGLLDLPVVLWELVGDTLGGSIETLLGGGADIIRAFTITTPGPFDGIMLIAVIVGVVVALARYGPLVLIASLELVPWIGPPLASLLRGGD